MAESTPSSFFELLKQFAVSGAVAYLIFVLFKRLQAKQQSIKDSSAVPRRDIKLVAETARPAIIQDTSPFLDKAVAKPIKLVKRTDLSHDSAVLRFALDNEKRILGLPVGKHFKLIMPNPNGLEEGKWNSREDKEFGKATVLRSYTPTSGDEVAGYVDLLVKFYKAGEKPQFPDGGKVSRQLHALKIGDTINIQGPFGLIEYKGNGLFKVGSKEVQVTHVGMMAGGSGITPMLQILRHSLQDKSDKTKFSLIYANQTEEDILVRAELEEYAMKNPERFHLHYTLDRPGADWKYSSGFITADMIKEHMPPPAETTLMLMCGPPPMVKFACKDNLDKLGYDKNSQVEF